MSGLVEVLSPSNEPKDWVRTMRDHATAGCPQHRIVSPRTRARHGHVLNGDAYRHDRTITAGYRYSIWGVDVVLDDIL